MTCLCIYTLLLFTVEIKDVNFLHHTTVIKSVINTLELNILVQRGKLIPASEEMYMCEAVYSVFMCPV